MTRFWEGKNVLVTGGAGFVGQHLCRQLLGLNANVTVIDDFSRGFTQINGVEYHYCDAGCSDAMHIYDGKDYVFNLAAACAGVLFNQRNNAYMFDNNVRLMSAPLMHAATLTDVKRFLQVSSVCVYGEGFTDPCVDTIPLQGEPVEANNGYAWAKRLGECMTRWYPDLYTVIVRPSNIYGPGDYFDERAHVIPALIRRCIHDDVVKVNGTGQERREFLYVEDAAKGMIHALQYGEHGQAYNLGSNGRTCITIRELVEAIYYTIHNTYTDRAPIEFEQMFDSGDDARWSVADKLARIGFGWEYMTSIYEGIERTVDYYKQEVMQCKS